MPSPFIIEKTPYGETRYDVYSRLLKDRIIFLGEEIDDEVANVIIAQMLFLEKEDPDRDIEIYINSPGGSVSAGLAIYDTMSLIKCDIATMAVGTAMSMAAILLSAGTKGKRTALPHSRIMIHDVAGGYSGKALDVDIQVKEMMRYRQVLAEILAQNTGKTVEQVLKDIDRDNFMSPEEAMEYGIIDDVIKRGK
ncbi:MAG: ATP-dependent Clp protease proteolytic subunit [Abditibacteriota bacterium]|nr:ATP-dependent Clp protease proteolytic subunit [Abditibacteriota bacterium]